MQKETGFTGEVEAKLGGVRGAGSVEVRKRWEVELRWLTLTCCCTHVSTVAISEKSSSRRFCCRSRSTEITVPTRMPLRRGVPRQLGRYGR